MKYLIGIFLVSLIMGCSSNDSIMEDSKVIHPVDSFYIKPSDENQIYSYHFINKDTLIGTSFYHQTIDIFTKVDSKDTFSLTSSVKMPIREKYSYFTYFNFNNNDIGVVFISDENKILRLNRQFQPIDSFDIQTVSKNEDIEFDFWTLNYVDRPTRMINDSILVVFIQYDYDYLKQFPENSNLLLYNINTNSVSKINGYVYGNDLLKRKYLGSITPDLHISSKEFIFYNVNIDSIYAYDYLKDEYKVFQFKNPYFVAFNDDFYIEKDGDTTNIDKKLWKENYFNKYLLSKDEEYCMLFYPPNDDWNGNDLIRAMRFDSKGESIQFYELDSDEYKGVSTFFEDDEYFYLYKEVKSLGVLAPMQIFKFRKDDFFK